MCNVSLPGVAILMVRGTYGKIELLIIFLRVGYVNSFFNDQQKFSLLETLLLFDENIFNITTCGMIGSG